jgi:hypothetical protein
MGGSGFMSGLARTAAISSLLSTKLHRATSSTAGCLAMAKFCPTSSLAYNQDVDCRVDISEAEMF